MRNRQRIWKLCKGLADQVRDIANSNDSFLDPVLSSYEEKMMSVYLSISQASDAGDKDAEQPIKFCVQPGGLECTELAIDENVARPWAQYKAETPKSSAERIVLYYAGSGDYMKYVCGIQLLPAGNSIGYITSHRRIIELEGKRALTVAMSQFGLLDISISQEADSPNWLNGRKAPRRYFDTVTHSRILFRHPALKQVDLKLSAELDASKIVSLTFESSSFIPHDELETSESALQLSWAFNFPAKSLKLSQITFPTLPPRQTESMPTYQILFEELPLRRITGWVNKQQEFLSGITFYTANDVDCTDTNLTLGNAGGTPIDFIVHGTSGEYLVGMDVYSWTQRKNFAGIKLCTNWGRVGIFTGYTTHLTDTIGSRSLHIPPQHEIVGLYAIRPRFLSSLPFLGILTQPSTFPILEPTISNEPKEHRICTALDVSEFLSTWSTEPTSIPSLSSPLYSLRTLEKLGHYATQAPVARIRQITCYRKLISKGATEYLRIIGLLLEYGAGGSARTTPASVLLGRISGYDQVCPEKLVLDPNKGETVAAIDKYVEAHSPGQLDHRVYIDGLRIHTNFGQSISWGNVQGSEFKAYGRSSPRPIRLRVRIDDILRFDYNLNSSLLFVDGYHPKQDRLPD
ncbi:hypothetical protein TWF281_000909 [Arthrobotrys megalospora]